MIREYLSLQDEADSVNEKIFKVCCHVEDLNRKIKTARDVLSRELPQKRKVVKSRK